MKFLEFFSKRQDLVLIGMLMLIVLVMIIPLPTVLIDGMIVLNLTLTILILIVAVNLERPDDFSAFPAVILISTTFRLAISISTTRMILSQADAGAIIDTFGTFVTQDSIIVGLVIFLIITTVQFVVITKGSERVAEVGARFALDALPGRQMSIDAELRSGDLTAEQAIAARKALEKENQFFGAMDGSMKFVKGDAIAGLIIIAINLLGGIAIGTLNDGMSAGAAAQVYSRLTVGDGLVSQIPAVILAICAGTIITKVTTENRNDLGTDITQQLLKNSQSLFIGAILMFLIGLIPGFPFELFVAVSAAMALGGWYKLKRERLENETEENEKERNFLGLSNSSDENEANADVSKADIFKINVGSDVYKNFNAAQFIEERDKALSDSFQKTGLTLPSFGVQMNNALNHDKIIITLDEVPVFNSSIPQDHLIAICETNLLELNDITVQPLDASWPFRAGHWVPQDRVDALKDIDVEIITLNELFARLGAHFLRTKADKVLGYKIVQEIIRDLAKEHEQLATQVSQTLSPVQMLNILRMLLEDGVPLLPRRVLFEALLEGTLTGGSTPQLAEDARFALSRQICSNYADDNRVIGCYVFEPDLTASLQASLTENNEGFILNIDGELSDLLLKNVEQYYQIEEINAKPPVLLVESNLRRPLSNFLKEHNLAFHVVSFRELANEFTFHPLGTIGIDTANDQAFTNYDEVA